MFQRLKTWVKEYLTFQELNAEIDNIYSALNKLDNSDKALKNDCVSENKAGKVVKRDENGNFSAGKIYANLVGNVEGNLTGNVTGTVNGTVNGKLIGEFEGEAEAIKDGVLATKLAIITGVVNHGDTLPLPPGYTKEQCFWIVSINRLNAGDHTDLYCYVEPNTLIVQCYDPSHGGGRANYLVIGVK